MSEIDEKTVRHLAQLARIELKDAEVASLQKDLNRILTYVDALKEVDTTGLPEVSQVTGLKNALREDLPQSSDEQTRESLLKSAPASENGYVKVKAVFNNDD